MTTCDLHVVENMQGGVVLLQENTLLLQPDDQLAARLGNLCTFTMLSKPCAQLFLVVYRQGIRGATQKFRKFKQGARTGYRMYALPSLDVASSMLCESVCQQL
jgi:hypothetical protein